MIFLISFLNKSSNYKMKPKLTYKNPAHSFKSNSNNSKRSRRNANKINNTKQAYVKSRRSMQKKLNKKISRIGNLRVYRPVCLKKEIRDSLNQGKHVVFAGGKITDIPDKVQGITVEKFHVNELKIIDSNDGFCIVDKEGNVVATKVERKIALSQRPTGLFPSLERCLEFAATNFTRGIQRIVGVHTPDGKKEAYFCRGFKPFRNKKGIDEKWGEKETQSTGLVKKIKSLITHCDKLMKRYTHPVHLNGFSQCEMGFMDSFDAEGRILASIAVGTGSYLNVHKDDDAFLSVITSIADKKSGVYDMNADVVTYFCFPDQGYAVALRAGDILIFNSANELHCSSSNTSKFIDETVFNCSIYLKTNVLSGNDNSE